MPQILDLVEHRSELAEEEGFEPPVHCCTTVFKTAAIDHSAIPPNGSAKIGKIYSFAKNFQ